jgi:hypothetical protein
MTYSAAIGRILALLALLVTVQTAVAAPAPPQESGLSSAYAPDWLSADSASQLDLGFPVLIPDSVPGPFGGEPSITAYDGYYSLYWLVPGTPRTYLQITGEVGGSIPDFSYYDRNNQLVVNASVRGYDAYHDLTPVYDRVYWQEGDVVYTVDSLNLSDTDSLSLANSLSPLAVESSSGNSDAGSGSDTNGDSGAATGGDNAPAPALSAPATVQSGGSVSLDISGVTDATLSADAGSFAGSGTDTLNDVGASTVSWQAPATDSDLSVLFILADPSNGDWLATANTTVTGTPNTNTATDASGPANTDPAPTTSPQSSAALTCDPTVPAGGDASIALTGSGSVTVDASIGGWPADPNSGFDASANGGTEVSGALADGPVNLVWAAPADGTGNAAITVSDSNGDTLATCAIAIQAGAVSTTSATTNASREAPRIASFFGDGTGLGKIGVSGKGSGDGTSVDPAPGHDPSRAEQPGGGSGDRNERGDATGMGRTATESPKPTAPANQSAAATSTRQPAAAESAPAGAATPAKQRTPSAAPTATLAPSSGPNGMVAKVIGPNGGTLESPAGAKLVIPPGALKEDATVTIMPVADAKLPVAENVEFVPGSAFDVTVAAPTGNSIDKLEKPATLTIALKPEQWRKGIALYWIDGSIPKTLDSNHLTESAISAETNHFSRFAAGLPTTAASSKRDPVPFLLGALGVVVLLLAIVGFVTAQRRRRPPSIPTRRNRTR